MKEFNIDQLKCPHCGMMNTLMRVTAPRDFKMKTYPTKCFVGGDVQKGCMKEFNVAMVVNVFTAKTQDQVAEELKNKKPENPYDKQASP